MPAVIHDMFVGATTPLAITVKASEQNGQFTPSPGTYGNHDIILDKPGLLISKAFNTPPAGTLVSILFRQDSVGGHTVTWDPSYVGASSVILAQGANQATLVQFVAIGDGTFSTITRQGGVGGGQAVTSVLDFGADPTGQTDSQPAFQACSNYLAGLVTSTNARPVMFIPPGSYLWGSEWLCPNQIDIQTNGSSCTEAHSDLANFAQPNNGLIICYTGDSAQLPTAAPLIGSFGKSLDFTAAVWNTQQAKICPSTWMKYTVLGPNMPQNTFSINWWMKLNTFSTLAPIYTAKQTLGTLDTGFATFEIGVSASGQIYITMTTTGGVLGGTALGAIPDTGVHYYTVDWDGTHVRGFIDGVLQVSTSATGTIKMMQPSCHSLGWTALGMYGSGAYNKPLVDGKIYSFKISKVSLHTSNFTPPVSAHTNDLNTVFLMNLDQIQGHNLSVEAGVGGQLQRLYLPFENCPGLGGVNNAGANISGLTLNNFMNGIWVCASQSCNFNDLTINSINTGILCTFHGFSYRFKKIRGSSQVVIALSGADGEHTIEDFVLDSGSTGIAPLYIDDTDNVRVIGGYLQHGQYNAAFFEAANCLLAGVYMSHEGDGYTPRSSLYVCGGSLEIAAGNFDTQSFDVPGMLIGKAVSGDIAHINMDAPFFSAEQVTAHLIDYAPNKTAGECAHVTISGRCNFLETVVPVFPASPGALDTFQELDKGTGFIGISGTQTAAKNIGGAFTAAGGGGATFTVSLPNAEPDANYNLTLCAKSSTGTPAAGSNRVLSYVPGTSSFTVTLEADPGVGNTVKFSWHLDRVAQT